MSFSNDPVEKEIVVARVRLLFAHPFFGNLATRLQIVDASKWCPTAATDGRRFYYNREFVKNLKPDELAFLFGHEILHCIFDHFGRRGGRIPEYWNAANDYIVNYTLVKERIGAMPKGGLYSEKYNDTMTSEEVYNLLLKEFPPQKCASEEDGEGKKGKSGEGSSGSGREGLKTLDQHLEMGDDDKDGKGKGKGKQGNQPDDGTEVVGRDKGWKDPNGNPDPGQETGVDYSDGPPSISAEELASIRRELTAAMIGAVQSNQGNAPAGVLRLIDDVTKPVLNWREILEAQIQSYYRDDFTFTRMNKKSWACGAILPGASYGNRLKVAVSIDTSGSISDAMVREFLAEVKAIIENFDDYEVHVWCIDAVVYEDTYKIFTPENVSEIDSYHARGGGGNDFPANWRFMESIDLVPEVFVLFSDGYPCGSWGDEDYCDTIFVIRNQWDKNIQVPFGLTIYMEDTGQD